MIPRARSSDPSTSQHAAMLSLAFSGKHKDRILFALQQHGPAAPPKLENLTGLTIVQIDRRLIEMQRDGLIRVVMAGGAELVAGGYRVWEAV